jgi:solute carrier family 10 (sodium/bile acid cotransporter), member 7
LCALPSTVSSSVALTAAARGNVPVAVFNATLSSLLGVFLTPLWVSWHLHTSGQPMALGPVVIDLVQWLLLPLALGQLSRPWLAEWGTRHRAALQRVDRGTILLIIYTSFCDSVQAGVWQATAAGDLAIMTAACIALFFVVLGLMNLVSTALGFSTEDKIATIFCGSKKSIAQGVPMARLIFGASPQLSVLLLPIMIYHSFQLIVCGVLASRWARRPTKE